MGQQHLQWKGDITHTLRTKHDHPVDVLKNVQFWSDVNSTVFGHDAVMKTVQYIDPQQIPPWNVFTGSGVWQVTCPHRDTQEFFQELVDTSDYDQAASTNQPTANVGILIQVTNPLNADTKLLVIYIETNHPSHHALLRAVPIVQSTDVEQSILATKAEPSDCEAAKFIADHHLQREKERKFNRLVARARSGTPSVSAVEPKDTSKTTIYKKPLVSAASTSTPASASASASPHPESGQERRNKKVITQVIMSELRLRGIKRSDNEEDFKQLYSHAYKATMFAFRRVIDQPMELERVRDTVDKLLNVLE